MDVGECKYDKNVPVLVDERKTFLNLKLNIIEKKLITVEATDEKDPFFLFTLQINETDFHNLKKEQALAVDFLSFPQTLLELLEHVESDSTRYQCVFSQGQLCIMEGGKMRPLPHIILQLKPANDATLKKYLANKLQEFKVNCL